MHVGNDGAARLETADPGQRVVDAEMAGMPGITQAVDNPEIEVFEGSPARGRDITDIGGIGGVPNAIAERLNIAMLQDERRKRQWTALPFDGPAFAGFDRVMVQDRRIVAARRRDEAVGK